MERLQLDFLEILLEVVIFLVLNNLFFEYCAAFLDHWILELDLHLAQVVVEQTFVVYLIEGVFLQSEQEVVVIVLEGWLRYVEGIQGESWVEEIVVSIAVIEKIAIVVIVVIQIVEVRLQVGIVAAEVLFLDNLDILIVHDC